MKKQLILFAVAILLIVVCLSGCSENRDQRFVGTWESVSGGELTFFSDGECSIGTWEVKEGKLVIDINTGGRIVYTFSFSDNNTKLSLTTDGITFNYVKK